LSGSVGGAVDVEAFGWGEAEGFAECSGGAEELGGGGGVVGEGFDACESFEGEGAAVIEGAGGSVALEVGVRAVASPRCSAMKPSWARMSAVPGVPLRVRFQCSQGRRWASAWSSLPWRRALSAKPI